MALAPSGSSATGRETHLYSTVSGGINKQANGELSTVSGGDSRVVSGQRDWAAGGLFQEN